MAVGVWVKGKGEGVRDGGKDVEVGERIWVVGVVIGRGSKV